MKRPPRTTLDDSPDEAALAELTADVQEIIRRAFGGRTLEQELEAAWADSERDRNQSAAQVVSVASLHARVPRSTAA